MPPFSSTWDQPGADTTGYLQPRRIRLRLYDGRTLEGRMHVADGQSAIEFLGMRRSFLNLTDVRWLDGRGVDAPLAHLGVRLAHVLWVVPLDPALPLSSAVVSPDASRAVELALAGGLVLRVRINIADEQRMSDYFDSNPDFIPLRSVQMRDDGDVVDRMAIHRDAILTIREI